MSRSSSRHTSRRTSAVISDGGGSTQQSLTKPAVPLAAVPSKRRRKERWIVAGVLVALLVVAIVIVVVLLTRRKKGYGGNQVLLFNQTRIDDVPPMPALTTTLANITSFSAAMLAPWAAPEGSWTRAVVSPPWPSTLADAFFWTGVDKDEGVDEYCALSVVEGALEMRLKKGKVYSPSFKSWHNRVQLDVKRGDAAPRVNYWRWRIRVQPDIETVISAAGEFGWRQFMELKGYPNDDLGAGEWNCRYNLGVQRNPEYSEHIMFTVNYDRGLDNVIWHAINDAVRVPADEDFELAFYYAKHETNGTFTVWFNGDAIMHRYNIETWCGEDQNPSSFNALKLYTSDESMEAHENYHSFKQFEWRSL